METCGPPGVPARSQTFAEQSIAAYFGFRRPENSIKRRLNLAKRVKPSYIQAGKDAMLGLRPEPVEKVRAAKLSEHKRRCEAIHLRFQNNSSPPRGHFIRGSPRPFATRNDIFSKHTRNPRLDKVKFITKLHPPPIPVNRRTFGKFVRRRTITERTPCRAAFYP